MDIEAEISKILVSSQCESEVFVPLINYVKPEKHNPNHIRHLSDHIARAFLKMGRYGGFELFKWLQKRGWKQLLWQRTLKTDLYDELTSLKPPKRGSEMHFFAHTSIPDVYLNFIERSQDAICHYILSPCQVFWGDVLSDSGRLALVKKKQDVCLQDRNPLLANWAIKHIFNQFEDRDVTEIYETYSSATLLGTVQQNILYSECRIPSALDTTIQVHAVSTRLREVEVLKNQLIDHLIKHQVNPCDVLVLAPNIAEYLPYIQKVFGDDCPFNYVGI